MTVYVDDAYVPATVGHVTSRWCHLVSDADDPTELHAFAARIGLRRAWFQPGRRPGDGSPDPTKNHYDLTEEARARAVAAGAVEITAHEGGRMRLARRAAARAGLRSGLRSGLPSGRTPA
ncbi:MAG: DUF4031 domain-containing protein [Pseudonocardia sp.]